MKLANLTDIGHVRSVNEDRVIVKELKGGLFLAVVADGMGGHQAGDLASQKAVEYILAELEHVHKDMSLVQLESMVKQSIVQANQAIYAIASEQDDLHGMGTTVVVVLATEQLLIIAHIGDSRLYLVHNGEIRQITEDHSLVNELVKSGQITYEESLHHPRKNVVTRALGTEPFAEPDLQHLYWDPSDIAVLCSDGLSNLVTPEQFMETLSLSNDLDFKAQQLIELALKAGGDDNISVALLWNMTDDQYGRGGME